MAMWMIIGVEGSVYNISAIKAEVARHELVFVGGMPNSGTSFVRGLLASEGVGKGQDVCRRTTNCLVMNVEGQWLLKGARIKEIVSPGNLSHALSVADYESLPAGDARDVILGDLWRSWSRYWDMSEAVLVEKSPTNLVRLRWLDAIFSRAKRSSFVVVVKSPVTLKSFEADASASRARHACLKAHRLGPTSTPTPASPCPDPSPDDVLRARLDFAEEWTAVHERATGDETRAPACRGRRDS